MSRKSIPPEVFMHAMLLRGGVHILDCLGPHLNPVTINPVIRIRLGPFFCPRDSEALSEQFQARSLQPLFLKRRMGVLPRRKRPETTPGRSNSSKIDIRPTGFNMTFFGTSLGTPFRAGTFRSTFSALFQVGASALL